MLDTNCSKLKRRTKATYNKMLFEPLIEILLVIYYTTGYDAMMKAFAV